jgi:hypothetical protein
MKWTETAIVALRRMWSGGASSREIGRELGVSHDSVTSKVRREGLERRGSPITNAPIDVFAEALSEHGDIERASRTAGVSLATGRSYFKHIQRELGWQAQ